MGTLSFIEGLQLLSSLGVLSGGVGVLRWGLTMERRVGKLEIYQEVQNGKSKASN